LTFFVLKVKKQKELFDLKKECLWDDCEESALNEHKEGRIAKLGVGLFCFGGPLIREIVDF
jgi:hypothetical protein